MKPAPWKCACDAGAFGTVSHSAFAVMCETCGEVAPWFTAIRAETREDVQAAKGTGA